MRDKVRWLALFLAFASFSGLGAQDADAKARLAYADGVARMKAGQNAAAVMSFDEAIRLLGRSNIRIQPSLLRVLAAMENWPRFSGEYGKYLEMQPDRNSFDFAELSALSKKSDEALAADKKDYGSAAADDTEAAYRGYLASRSFPLFASQAAERREALAWKDASAAASWQSLKSFLAAWPSGGHSPEARARLQALDDKAWALASSDTAEAYDAYLRACPGGSRSAEAASRADAKREAAAWAAAQANPTISGLKDFLQRFPRGANASSAKSLLAKLQGDATRADYARQYEQYTKSAEEYEMKSAGFFALGCAKIAGGIGGCGLAAVGILSSDMDLPLRVVLAGGGGALGGYCLTTFKADFAKSDNYRDYAREDRRNAMRYSLGFLPVMDPVNGAGLAIALRVEY